MNKKDEQFEQKPKRSKISIFLLITLILLFIFTLYITIQYIIKYTNGRIPREDEQIIEIKTKEASATIINNGIISETVDANTFVNEDEVIVENINVIEIVSNDRETKSITFNVKYDITQNDFKDNIISTNDSEVLVKFSYSFDNKNWTYINNVITTDSSNISPLIGNRYDISGLVTKLNVATNFELTTNNKNGSKMFWRSETIFKNATNSVSEKELKANFTLEYNGSF